MKSLYLTRKQRR